MIRAIFLLALSVIGIVSITALRRIVSADCGSCETANEFWLLNEWLWISGTPTLFFFALIFGTLRLVKNGERFLRAVPEAFIAAFQTAAMVFLAATSAAHLWYVPQEFIFGGRTLEAGRYMEQFGAASEALRRYYGLG